MNMNSPQTSQQVAAAVGLPGDGLFSVAGQTVLVSGGSRGIGKALAAGFASRGARVIITGRDAANLKLTASEIGTAENPVAIQTCDVAVESDVQRCVEETLSKFGHVDTLVNCAGVNIRKRMETYTSAEYDHILNINLRGLFFLTQGIGKSMIARQQGCVINIDSLNSRGPLRAVLPYAISKSGVSALTRGLAMEWGQHGIRVNAIAPGFILTDLTRKLWSNPVMQQWADANTPLKRLGEVEDLIGTAIFLAAPASRFMTGQVVYVDGGVTAGLNWPIPLD